MTQRPHPSWDEIFGVMSAASVGDTAARVNLPDDPEVEDLATRFGVALNLLLDDLALRTADLRQEAENRRTSEARVRAMVDSALDAVIGMDRDGTVVEWNDRAAAIFGWTRAETLGQPLASLIIPTRYRERHWAGLERYNRTGEGPVLRKLIELEAVNRSGYEFPVELSISPVEVPGGTIFSAFVRDITEQRRQERALKALQDVAFATGHTLDHNDWRSSPSSKRATSSGFRPPPCTSGTTSSGC